MFEYEIDSRKFIQQPLVWGQAKQLKAVVSKIKLNAGIEMMDLLDILGDQVPMFCAIVLREDGVELKDKNIEVLASEFENSLDVATSMKVLEDFFVCNPIDLISKSLLGLGQAVGMIVRGGLPRMMARTPSIEPSVPLPEEISPNEIQ
jgi:DNA-binding ferritin-like protein (Dps family)